MIGWTGWSGRRRVRRLGEILPGLLRRKKFYEKGRHGGLADAWRELVGEGVAGHTRIRSFQKGELVVEVDSPVLLHELNSFMKEQLLAEMQAVRAGRDVAGLRFCLGNRRDSASE